MLNEQNLQPKDKSREIVVRQSRKNALRGSNSVSYLKEAFGEREEQVLHPKSLPIKERDFGYAPLLPGISN